MLVERHVPSDVRNHSRSRRRAVSVSASPRRRSLDSSNHLATTASETVQESFGEFLKRQETAQDKRRKLYSVHDRLLESLKASAHRQDYLYGDMIRSRSATEPGTGWGKAEKRLNRAKWQPWKDYNRVAACQTQWKGFRASCCDGRAVAVPIGCNHRLCPLCNAHRAEHFRERVTGLFSMPRNSDGDARNWQLLTLTVPNCKRLTALTIKTLRARLKKFLKMNQALILGGVYSIEITFNRENRTWHPHIHALVDVAGDGERLPYFEFLERKWRLEFDWFVLTQGKRTGQRRWDHDDFVEWVSALDPRRGGHSGGRFGDRRSVDIRPVATGKKAAYEVMKYMTKVAFFVDDSEAVAEFLTAVKGVRAIQTFGSCYGFKLEEKPAEARLSCECGENKFESIGILSLGMVRMADDGTWYVRDDAPVHGRHHRRCRGTPT